MSCGYDCELSCEECDVPDRVMEFVNGYNLALEDFAEKILNLKPQDEEYRSFKDVVEDVKEQLRK